LGNDFDEVILRLGWLGRSDDKAAWDEAWALVTDHWEVVRALGDALLRKNELNGEEVEEIILQALVVRRRQSVPVPRLGEPHGCCHGLLDGGYLPSASDH
jgi:hypothetical protein